MMGTMRPGLDHVTIAASDFARSIAFYDAALGELGMQRVVEVGDEEEPDADLEAAGWGAPGEAPVLWLVASGSVTSGVHVSLRAPDRGAVERFHAAAVRAGGTSHDAPRRWPIYRRGEFTALVCDPDGNLVQATSGE
jgi:catechol 2,3-dioxygenase-like lactoylglutathione lyase family enzyme